MAKTISPKAHQRPWNRGIFRHLIYPIRTPETLAVNFVIVDIGNRKYACYAHIVNGSVRVKAGDTVREGQVLGLMGNSGNSDLLHLHYFFI